MLDNQFDESATRLQAASCAAAFACPPLRFENAGKPCWHCERTKGHREENKQPAGKFNGLGISPTVGKRDNTALGFAGKWADISVWV